MPWDVIIFLFIAGIAVAAAAGMVISSNPVHSAVFLVLCFIQIAAVFVMLGAEFLGIIQIIVYTGAILVLLLFVMMLVDPEDLPEFHTGRPVQLAVGALLGIMLLLEVAVAIATRTITGTQGTATPENIDAVGGNTQAIGRVSDQRKPPGIRDHFARSDGRCSGRDCSGSAGTARGSEPAANRYDLAWSSEWYRSGFASECRCGHRDRSLADCGDSTRWCGPPTRLCRKTLTNNRLRVRDADNHGTDLRVLSRIERNTLHHRDDGRSHAPERVDYLPVCGVDGGCRGDYVRGVSRWKPTHLTVKRSSFSPSRWRLPRPSLVLR